MFWSYECDDWGARADHEWSTNVPTFSSDGAHFTPCYVTDIQQGMLPEGHELSTFIEHDYKKQRERAMIENEAFLDEIEDIMDSMPCTQPGFDPSGLFTPVWTQDDDHTSILAYDSDRTISYQSPDVRSYLMSCMSENTTDSYDSDGHDVSVELTPDTPM